MAVSRSSLLHHIKNSLNNNVAYIRKKKSVSDLLHHKENKKENCILDPYPPSLKYVSATENHKKYDCD